MKKGFLLAVIGMLFFASCEKDSPKMLILGKWYCDTQSSYDYRQYTNKYKRFCQEHNTDSVLFDETMRLNPTDLYYGYWNFITNSYAYYYYLYNNGTVHMTGGTVTVNKGTYKTTGKGSPTIYSTADITVKNATLTATASEGVVIEGKNSVTLENVDLTDTNNTLNGQSTTYKNIFLYQSMSGDAANGEATFTAKNSKITTNKGDSFYITNTTATINLENNEITNTDSTGYFLRSQKDSWGNSGSNGGIVTLNLTNQKVNGNIYIDSISTLTMNMVSSNYEGGINTDNTAKSITIKLDSSSTIKLTGDSYITSLEDSDSTYSNIDLNGYKLYVNGKELTK